ncbi:hypothetical protein RHMOL_Rhmol11G0112400 [Rhododendron molle]|uniref:Uncharacterized protein n=1 Tax=Rhododendron molle TaxID=49168 RepID=A0ACC0LSL7_RHOML|nr:hypothetical protein RHMOL_Rhmol11G0112400 [Rhododendron molle]
MPEAVPSAEGLGGRLRNPSSEGDQKPLIRERDLKPEISQNMADSVLGDEQIIDVGQERSRPTVNPIGRSELHLTTILEQEERHEEEENDDTLDLDHDSLVIGDPSPPPINEGLFGNVRSAKCNYKCRPTIGIKMVELHPRWICGAHQKRVLFTCLCKNMVVVKRAKYRKALQRPNMHL